MRCGRKWLNNVALGSQKGYWYGIKRNYARKKKVEQQAETVPQDQVEPMEPVEPVRIFNIDEFTDYPDGVTVVRDVNTARRVVNELCKLEQTYHACDTETKFFDETEFKYGNASIYCASIYAGPNYDFGSGPLVWIGLSQLS